MPVYNGADFLPSALSCIAHQSEADFEFLIVDDGSTDDTLNILKTFANSDKRVRVIQRPHQGIVKALNAGLQLVTAPLIARMDADDCCAPNRLERQKHYLDMHQEIGLVATKVNYEGDMKRYRGFRIYVDWVNSLQTPSAIYLNRFIESPLIHPSTMFRQELVQRYGGYREGHFPEDYELWLRWLDAGVRMAKLPEALLDWRERRARLSRTNKRYSVNAFFNIKSYYLGRWLSKKLGPQPSVWVWGAGKFSRKRAELLSSHGVKIAAYIDIDPRKIGNRIQGRPVLSKEQLPSPSQAMILSYVTNRGARDLIRNHLEKKGFVMGKSFILAG